MRRKTTITLSIVVAILVFMAIAAVAIAATVVACSANPCSGTAGSDDIYGQVVNGNQNIDDTIDAGAGDDSVTGFEGNDTIRGGPGNDSISGNAGDDILSDTDGNDQDFIYGGPGNDFINIADGDTTQAGIDFAFCGEEAGDHDIVHMDVNDYVYGECEEVWQHTDNHPPLPAGAQ